MFQKICIKKKELVNQEIDISFLIDTMFFYGKVILLAHKKEIITLLEYFGETLLFELIKSGRLELRIRENILASLVFPGDKFNIDLISGQNETFTSIIYQAHRTLVKNSIENIKFADELSKITHPFRYSTSIIDQIRNEFHNKDLLKKLLPIYINHRVPSFNFPNNFEIEIIKDGSFGPIESYSLRSNLNIEEFNKKSKELNGELHYDFDYSGFFLVLSESQGDIYLSSHFESELVTKKLYSDFINQQLQSIIQKRLNSQSNIELFEEYALRDYHTIGDSFVSGIVTKKDLLKLFEKADKFREWLLNVPEDKSLIGEYHTAVTKETFADKLPTKTTRFLIFESIGITLDLFGTGGIGTVAATGLSVFDNFYLDKILGGWKPNHFIDNSLKPKLKRKNS